ncbi:hypothetical protein QE109_11955 [Fusibacter bizertensis]|uniref:Uncharacterized protein n=1 Tax=Fusibacter bizertensis TaxID=1488331 RepID=A0ABT6NEM2_9FIRM|nr:hypothetical protein [Fusibacter bizertensis]MDH8678869.1 hypothetical protein [Fusibacter bizertensis]
MLLKIFEVLLFAVAITIIMAWGNIKKQRQAEELGLKLVKRCEQKVLKAFNRNNFMNQSELLEEITGEKASLFWSRKKAVLDDPKVVLDAILVDLLNKGWIVEGKQKTFTWVKEEE